MNNIHIEKRLQEAQINVNYTVQTLSKFFRRASTAENGKICQMQYYTSLKNFNSSFVLKNPFKSLAKIAGSTRLAIVSRVPFHTRQNKFEDRGLENAFIVFPPHCAGKMLALNNHHILDSVYIRKSRSEKLQDYPDVIAIKKLRFQNV